MSHDYEPSWDYPVIELCEVDISQADKDVIEKIVDDAKSTLAPAMGFDEIEVFFTESMGLTSFLADSPDVMGIYCNGTSSLPVVGFDLKLLSQLSEENNSCFIQEFKISIAHELAHAYQESIGADNNHDNNHDSDCDNDCDSEYGNGTGLDIERHAVFDEDAAEAFGREWAECGSVNLDILNGDSSGLGKKTSLKF